MTLMPLVFERGRPGRPQAAAARGAPEPVGDMRLDRLGVQPLLADPRDEHLGRHLAGAETGNLGVLPVVGSDFAKSRSDFIGGHVDDQLTSAIGIEDGTVGMAVLVVVSCFSVILFLLGFSRFRFAFECAAGAQDSTFF